MNGLLLLLQGLDEGFPVWLLICHNVEALQELIFVKVVVVFDVFSYPEDNWLFTGHWQCECLDGMMLE